MAAAVGIWRRWKSIGLLPVAGAMSDQDAIVANTISTCEEELGRARYDAESSTAREIERLNKKGAR